MTERSFPITVRWTLLAAAALTAALFVTSCREVYSGKREARGVWVSRFDYASADSNAAKAKITDIFAKARKARLNMVFFQVRGNGDAFYRSAYEPWAAALTGKLGADPGWDPLAYAVGEAHRHGLEFHAWVNTFPVWRGPEPPPETTPRSPYLAHPEWIVCDGEGRPMPPGNEYISFSPGIPAARQYIIGVVLDIVRHYDVDGIHFDYIRYPDGAEENGYSHDSISVARFESADGNPYHLSWAAWEREQLNIFVYDAYNAITAVRPDVKVSAAVVGKYDGSGWTAYNSVFQDPRRWMELGKMDFLVPMVYWERGHPTHPFTPIIGEWADRLSYSRMVFPGILAGLRERFGWSEIEDEIDDARQAGLHGVVFFAAGSLGASWNLLGTDEFPYWANVPAMTWKDSVAPLPPTLRAPRTEGQRVRLSWIPAAEADPAVLFNLYRSHTPFFNISDPRTIITVAGRADTTYLDTPPGDGPWYYLVTGLDRCGNESAPSNTAASAPPTIVAQRHE